MHKKMISFLFESKKEEEQLFQILKDKQIHFCEVSGTEEKEEPYPDGTMLTCNPVEKGGCGKTKPATKETWYKDSRAKKNRGWMPICKECYDRRRKNIILGKKKKKNK